MPIKTEKKIGKDRNKYIQKDMANPIQKTDLITDEALSALTTMSTTLSTIAENLTKAKAACQGWGEEEKKTAAATGDNVEELTKMAARITQLEDAIKKLNAAEKENENARRSVNEQKRLYRKLTDDEIKSVEDLKRALQGSVDEQMKAVNAIEVEKKSYNELNQVYNALKDTLNKMTTAQRQNTDAGKAMTAQASKVYETMNQLQQATGKYTLQVGKYRAAFDGLGYSFQQILREAPSALNLNQFFLAISNNIPQFLDQVKAFNEEQKAIKANLATMTEGTQEYAEELGKVMTLGQKLARTLLSWQSLVLVGLLIVRNWDKIVNLISKITTKTREWAKEVRNLRYEYNELDTKIRDSIRNTNLELDEIMRRLPNLSSGTTEWANAVARVNEMTGSTLTATTATVDEVGKVTQAYKEQIEQLAKNKFVIERIAESVKQSMSLDEAMKNNRSLPALARILGLTEGSDEYKQFQKRFEQYYDEWSAAPGGRQMGGPGIMRYGLRGTALRKNRYQLDEEFRKYLQDTYFKDILTEKEIESLWDKYYKPLVNGSNNNGPKGSSPSEQSTSDRYWEAEQELLEKMKTGYDLERALAKLNRDKEREELINWYVDQRLALDENLKNGFISQQKYDADIQELDRENATLREGINRKYWDNINRINREEAEKALKAREDRTIREINAITAVELKASSKRVRNTAQEAAKNNVLVENLNRLLNARKELIALDIASDETRSIEERTKALEKLNKEISKYASQLDFSKRLGTYSSLSDMITKNINVSGGNKKSILTNIIGEDAMKTAAESLGEGFEDWVDGQFETWMNSATQAVSQWYNTTMGYINDLISAYVELANAKAEAAKEATEAAQEEYDKEKALLEAGYASRVEATWAEYQEKKAAQEKAEEDAKAAAKAQQEINNLSTMGSLITAAANIWKTFTEIPVVGIPLAIAATGTMFGAFLAAKIKANEVSKYGEGGFEVLEGGSHASGHDIDLGVRNRRGRRMKAEGKEGLGIFSRRAMSHYGASNIEAMVNSVNRLEFEGNAAKRMSLERSVGMAVLSAPRTDLHRVESDLHKLVGYGSRSRTVNADGSVTEIRKNAKIVYKNG